MAHQRRWEIDFAAFDLLRSIYMVLKDPRSRGLRFSEGVDIARFRLRASLAKGADISVVACPPYDVRMATLLRHMGGRVVIFTSWPHWESHGTRVPPGFLRPVARRAWRRFSSRVDAIAGVTPKAARSAGQALNRSACPSVTVGHVVDSAFFQVPLDLGATDRGIRLLYVGRLDHSKGLDRIVPILSELEEKETVWRLDVVGCGRKEGVLRDRLRPFQRKIAFRGYLRSSRKLACLMARADVLLSPGRKTPKWEELFGIAIAESLAAGTPVVASNHVGPRHLLRGMNDGLLVDGWAHEEEAIVSFILAAGRDTRQEAARRRKGVSQFGLASVRRRWGLVLDGALG